MPNEHGHHAHDQHVIGRGAGHGSLWLAGRRRAGQVHRVGRRQFLTELGRSTFAIAVLGGAAAACSSEDDGVEAERPYPATEDSVGAAGDAARAEGTVDDGPPGSNAVTDADQVRWAQARLGSVSAYVLVRGNEAAVVDTGNPGSAAEIGRALATLSATYDDVRHVVLTHSHPDHIGSLAGVLEAAPSAVPYAGALDIPNIAAPVDVTAVGDGDDVFGLRIIETPGHTPGSISVLDPGIGLLLAGDALNGNAGGTALAGPNERFTADMGVANRSVLKLAGYEVEAVGMGHGQPLTTDAGTALVDLVDQLVVSGEIDVESSSE